MIGAENVARPVDQVEVLLDIVGGVGHERAGLAG
jgi:hypothetical protein